MAPCACRIEATCFSEPGGRGYNEDVLGDCELAGGLRLFLLADGAGGQGGGDVAARTAVLAAQSALRERPGFSLATLRHCIACADRAVVERQRTHAGLGRMASTLVLLLVDCAQGQALLGSIGDSRGYVFRGHRVAARSRDHSLVQQLVDAGFYPAERLRAHPQRNVLYACLGANEEGAEPYVCEEPIALQPGDGVLLCSDGVWELLEDSAMGELHAGSDTVEAWRDRLLRALEACMPERHDNYSAWLLRCLPAAGDASGTPGPETVSG